MIIIHIHLCSFQYRLTISKQFSSPALQNNTIRKDRNSFPRGIYNQYFSTGGDKGIREGVARVINNSIRDEMRENLASSPSVMFRLETKRTKELIQMDTEAVRQGAKL